MAILKYNTTSYRPILYWVAIFLIYNNYNSLIVNGFAPTARTLQAIRTTKALKLHVAGEPLLLMTDVDQSQDRDIINAKTPQEGMNHDKHHAQVVHWTHVVAPLVLGVYMIGNYFHHQTYQGAMQPSHYEQFSSILMVSLASCLGYVVLRILQADERKQHS